MSGDFAPTPKYMTPAVVFGRFDRIIDEVDPSVIDQQIAYGLEIEAAGGVFFNNFMHSMPGGMYQAIVPEHMIDDHISDPAGIDQTNPLARSVKSTEVTWREFFADVDRAVDDAGLDRNEIHRLRHVFDAERSSESSFAFTRYILPAYKLLRAAGYSHGDLYS